MTTSKDRDVVTGLIKRCLDDRDEAQRLFKELITDNRREIELPDGKLQLTQKQHDEFVARYSSEVGPTIWESKRAKT